MVLYLQGLELRGKPMTKLVRVYELRVKEEIVPEFTSYIDTHHYNVQDTHVLVRDEQPWLMDVTTTHTKIQEFEERRLPEHLRQYKYGNPVDEIQVSKTYIVIDEGLEEILSAKYNAEILRQAREYSNKEFNLEYAICTLHRRIDEFNNLPWYKRVWRGIRNTI
jgi:DNA topoisomerase VI subunit B